MSDYISELRQDLVEAAAREQRRGRAGRVARPLRPRAWSRPALAGALAIAAVLVAVVLTLTTVAPPPQPADPKVIATVRLDGQPRDAVLAGGSLWVADYEGRVLQVDPVRRRVRARVSVGGTPLAVAAEGDRVLGGQQRVEPRTSTARASPRSTPGPGAWSRARRSPGTRSTSSPSAPAVSGGPCTATAPTSSGIDLDTLKRTALITDTDVFGIAATERSLWTREPNTLSEWDASGRLVNRLRGLSLPIGRPSERTLLPDADGAWVVGQSDGLLYRVESGRVVRRVKVGPDRGHRRARPGRPSGSARRPPPTPTSSSASTPTTAR